MSTTQANGMISRRITFGLVLCFVFSFASCGGGSQSPPTPSLPPVSGESCSATLISGTLQDSLTGQPIAGAKAVLETGAQLMTFPEYNFAPKQTALSDANGKFQICASSTPTPSMLVIVASDATGKAYPPFVSAVTGATDLGSIAMGSCHYICGFEGQQQTSLPATIDGTITTTPVGKTGTVVPQFPMSALDGSKVTWNIAVPTIEAQTTSFATTASACSGAGPFCATYSFTLPSQRPVRRDAVGYWQESAPPYYAVYAVVDGAPSCSPPFAFTGVSQDGAPLKGAPGAHVKAAPLAFAKCQ